MISVSSLHRNIMRMVGISLVFASLVVPAFSEAASQPRDNDANAIMYGGAYSKSEWAGKVSKGDTKNSASNLQQIYYNEGRGITNANFMASYTVDGVVFKDGHVEVDGKTVATGAKSVGRTYMDGSTKSGSVWERPTSVSFGADSIPAFVDMQNGEFHYAIIKSCGNPVKATPVKKPAPTVTPTPKPTPTPTPAPEQSFTCLKLTPSQPDKTNKPTTFRFTVSSSVKNVTLSGYRFTLTNQGVVADSDVKDTDAAQNYTDFILAPGTWKVQAQVKTTAGISEVKEACSAIVTVSQATPTPTPIPTPGGEVLGVTLPATGPESALGGVVGLTAVGYAGRAYLRSRKSVLAAMRTIKRPHL